MEKKDLKKLSLELHEYWICLANLIRLNSGIFLHSSKDEEISDWFNAMAEIERNIKELKQRSLLFFRLQQRFQDKMSKNDIQPEASNE